jgi:type VI secretion system protein
MNQGLFESLTGNYLDGTPVDAVTTSKNRRVRSIMDHLNRLFNTRQGSLTHLHDYGLPDISEVYRRMPDGVEDLRDAVKRAVERYEPRLKRVRVVKRDSDVKDFKLVFIVSGELKEGGLVRFETSFSSLGNSSIAPWKKQD